MASHAPSETAETIMQRVSIALCLSVMICAGGRGALRAEKPASSVLYDKAAMIRELAIHDPKSNPYLTLDEWLHEAPTPPRSLSKERKDAFYRAWTTLWLNTQPAEGAWIKPIISPGQRYMNGIWLWDAAFHVLGLAHGGHKARQLGLWQIEVMLSGQQASGKIPREIWKKGPRSFGKHGIQPPGILTLASNRLYQAAESDQEKESVRKAIAGFYSQFVKNHEWFWLNTRIDNGLCTWKTVDSWDTSPRWDRNVTAALDLNCWLYLDCVELARMAESLGKPDAAKDWNLKADDLRKAIHRTHWSSKLGVFNDVVEDGSISTCLTPVIFWPLWVGLATEQEAASTVKYLADPKVFDVKWPIPSVAVNDPAFRPDDYWRGPVWINLNWVTIRGLHRYGHHDAARALTEKTLDLIARSPILYEYYNPLTGDGLGSPHYGWTSSLYIDLILGPAAQSSTGP